MLLPNILDLTHKRMGALVMDEAGCIMLARDFETIGDDQ